MTGPLRLIRDSVIGEDHVRRTPYGGRRVTCADCTASGRALSCTSRRATDRSCSSAPHEHHSTEIPWREFVADVVVTEPDLTPPPAVSADFEHLRWFDLPAASIASVPCPS